jgi:serine/threonine protein kinase
VRKSRRSSERSVNAPTYNSEHDESPDRTFTSAHVAAQRPEADDLNAPQADKGSPVKPAAAQQAAAQEPAAAQAECLSATQIDDLLHDRLDDESSAPLWAHAERCRDCAQVLAAVGGDGSLLVDLKQFAVNTTTRGLTSHAHPSRAHTRPGADAFEGYELLEAVSSGGQGVVYRAYQKATKRDVALKVLRGGANSSLAARRRFDREVELAGQLRHPNIVTIFDSGVTADGEPYYVMDYVPGQPLDRYISQARLTRDTVLELVAQIADAIAHAHQHGVIHRDLKPSNVLVDESGRPLILDFGLARKVEPSDADPTETGQVLGTLPYMSPEQAAGDRTTSTLTDVYALGVILYRLLVGQFPYPVTGSPWEVVRHIMSTEPTSLIRGWSPESGVPLRYAPQPIVRCPIDSDLETIVLKALQKEPERRYQSAGELAEDLRNFLRGEPVLAKRDSAWYLARKFVQRNKLAVSVVVLLLIITGGFGTTTLQALLGAQQARDERDQAKATARDATLDRNRIAAAETLPMVRRMQLGWALLLWQQGKLDETALKPFPPGSSERLLLDGLLDPAQTVESLHAKLPAGDQFLAELLAAERAIAADDRQRASEALSGIVASAPDTWVRQYAAARLAWVQQSASSPGGE